MWPGKLTQYRKYSPFRANWTDTLKLLERETDMLNAKNIVMQFAITEREVRIDGAIRADARPQHPGIILSFDSKFGSLQYATDIFDKWQDNVRAIALSLEALRKVDRYGVSKRGEQYTGWKALPAPDSEMTEVQAKTLLESYGGERQALKSTHPDAGGKVNDFRRVQKAREVLGLA